MDTNKIAWEHFRKIFIKFGGDSIYAASKILQDEPSIKYGEKGKCFKTCRKSCLKNCKGTPEAKLLQRQLLNFSTNQGNKIDIQKQILAIRKTINFFNERL